MSTQAAYSWQTILLQRAVDKDVLAAMDRLLNVWPEQIRYSSEDHEAFDEYSRDYDMVAEWVKRAKS